MNSRPIGVFDSGVGGLTVLRAMHLALPRESTVYIGDLAYFPYGPKGQDVVHDRACAIRDYLLELQVKLIVVACNTATSAALADLAATSPCPVIGVVVPGAEAAVKLSGTKRIGVVATEGTTRSRAYRRAILPLCPNAHVSEIASPSLVGLIEAGQTNSRSLREVVEASTNELITARGCDTIILGCTHFPLVRHIFEQISGARATIVDSVASTVTAVCDTLAQQGLLSHAPTEPQHKIFVTAHADAFVRQARLLFGEQLYPSRVVIGATPPLAALASA